MKEICSTLLQSIQIDLVRLKTAGIINSTEQGSFKRVNCTFLYVYSHNDYKEGSKVNFEFIEGCTMCPVTEEVEVIVYCGHQYHDNFIPFYLSNSLMLSMLKEARLLAEECRHPILDSLWDSVNYVCNTKQYRPNTLDNQCFFDEREYDYCEDTWSKRLFYILTSQYQNHVVEYTADLRGQHANGPVLARMPPGTPISVLLFHGSPDLIIKHKPVTLTTNKDMGASEGAIENKTSSEMTPYKIDSIIPKQAGQVVAYIYQLMVACALRKLVKGHPCSILAGSGLYIIKRDKKIHFKVKLSSRGMEVHAKCYLPADNPSPSLCRSLHAFVESVVDVE